jgi:hypothetical protein
LPLVLSRVSVTRGVLVALAGLLSCLPSFARLPVLLAQVCGLLALSAASASRPLADRGGSDADLSRVVSRPARDAAAQGFPGIRDQRPARA